MFEKEAEESYWNSDASGALSSKENYVIGFKDGYNKAKVEVEESYRESLCNSELNLASVTERLEELKKANEWYYPSKGSLPKDLCLVIACFWELGEKQVREVYFDSKYFCYHGKHIEPVAWQYFPVPPKEEGAIYFKEIKENDR